MDPAPSLLLVSSRPQSLCLKGCQINTVFLLSSMDTNIRTTVDPYKELCKLEEKKKNQHLFPCTWARAGPRSLETGTLLPSAGHIWEVYKWILSLRRPAPRPPSNIRPSAPHQHLKRGIPCSVHIPHNQMQRP